MDNEYLSKYTGPEIDAAVAKVGQLSEDVEKIKEEGNNDVDLSDYALKDDLKGYQPKGNYATEAFVVSKVNEAQLGGGDGEAIDLSVYLTKDNAEQTYQPKGDYALKSEIPTIPVQSVNGKTGAVQLSAADVGAQPTGDYALKSEIPTVPVQSVNGKTGAVTLGAADVGAQPKGDYLTEHQKLKTINGQSLVGEGNIEVQGASVSGETVPQYVVDEAVAVIDKVAAAQGNRTFTLAAIADMHYGNGSYTDGIKHACQALKYIDERIKLDAVAVLGDYTDGNPETNYSDAIADFRAVNAVLSGLRFAPNLRVHGNHDYYAGHMPEVYRYTNAYSEGAVWGDGPYFFRDFGKQKLRIICLNTVTDNVGNVGYTDAQAQWFADALNLSDKDDVASWQVLVLTHHPVDFGHASGMQYKLTEIINAYINGASYTGGDVSCNFAGKNAATFVGNIHGHIHNLLVDRIYNGGVSAGAQIDALRIATPESCYGKANTYDGAWKQDESYGKTKSTASDTSFVVYCIDLDTNTIKAICYGAGYDRTITYGSNLSWDGMPDNEGGGTGDDTGGGEATGYTNQIPVAIDQDGNVVTGCVMYADSRYSSSGSVSSAPGYNITGLIPAKIGDFIRVRWTNGHESEKYGDMGYQGFRAFNASREPIAVRLSFQTLTDASNGIGAAFTAADGFYYDREGGVIDFKLVGCDNVPVETAYLAFTLGCDLSEAIITVNEPID